LKLARTTLFGIFILALAFGAGCSNPADDKAEAKVGEETPAVPVGSGERYAFAEGSKVSFEGSKVTGSHEGGFNEFTGEVMLVDSDPTKSSVSVEINLPSVWSDHPKLTEHLKSTDFFAVDYYKLSTFQSSKIVREGEQYTVSGNFQLHGVVRNISFPATITVEPGKVTVNAEFFIKRFDFDMEFAGPADNLIRDEVVIKLELIAEPAEAA